MPESFSPSLGAEVIKVESMKKLDDMRVYRRGDINKAPIFRKSQS